MLMKSPAEGVLLVIIRIGRKRKRRRHHSPPANAPVRILNLLPPKRSLRQLIQNLICPEMLLIHRKMNQHRNHGITIANDFLQKPEAPRLIKGNVNFLQLLALTKGAVIIIHHAVRKLHVMKMMTVVKSIGS